MFELAVHRLTFIREHCLFSRILHRKRCTSVIRRKFDFRQFIRKLYNEIGIIQARPWKNESDKIGVDL